MKIKDYVKVLPRFIDRLTVSRKVETTFEHLADVKTQLEEFNELRPTAQLPKSLDKFNKALKGLKAFGKPSKREPLYVILEALKIVVEGKSRITDYIKREITADVATTAISYKKANILIYITSLNNAGQLLTDLLWLLTILETTKNENEAVERMTKAVYARVIDTLNSHGAELVKVLSVTSGELIDAFNKVPDVIIAEDDAADAFMNSKMVDPFSMGFLPANNANPFFFIGKVIINIEDIIYQNRLEMKQLIELRLADLRSRDESAESPALQTEIEKLENKLATINYKLEKAKSDAA